jgi:polyhydroxyalkanoate synthesis regulator phasin
VEDIWEILVFAPPRQQGGYRRMYEERFHIFLQAVVQAVVDIMKETIEQFKNGEITEKQAKVAADEVLNAARRVDKDVIRKIVSARDHREITAMEEDFQIDGECENLRVADMMRRVIRVLRERMR